MLKDTEESEIESRAGASWVLWVAGWGLLVGCLAAVVPAFLLFGSQVAVWTGSAVVLGVAAVAWLGAEAERAVFEDRRRSLLPPEEFRSAKRVTTIH